MEINPVAWWGAIVATIVLVWDFYKTINSGPKLRVSAKKDVCYVDSEYFDGEKDKAPAEGWELKPSIHLEVANIGNAPTTIMRVDLSGYKSLFRWYRDEGWRFEGIHRSHGQDVPFVLKVGEIWSCRLDQVFLENSWMQNTKSEYLRVHFAHSKKPIRIRLKLDHKKKANHERSRRMKNSWRLPEKQNLKLR